MPLIEKATRERMTVVVLSGLYDEIDDLVRIDCMLRDWMGGWAGKPGAFAKKKTLDLLRGPCMIIIPRRGAPRAYKNSC